MPDEPTDPALPADTEDGATAEPTAPVRARRPAPAVVPRHLRPDTASAAASAETPVPVEASAEPPAEEPPAAEPAESDSIAGRLQELEARLSAEPAAAEAPAPAKKAVRKAAAKKAPAAEVPAEPVAETQAAPADADPPTEALAVPVAEEVAGDAVPAPAEEPAEEPTEEPTEEPAEEPADAPAGEPLAEDAPVEEAATATPAKAPVKAKAPAKKAVAPVKAPAKKAPAKKAVAKKAPAVDLAPAAVAGCQDASLDDLMGGSEPETAAVPTPARRPVAPTEPPVAATAYRPATELVPAQGGGGGLLWALAALLLAVAVGLGVAALVRGQDHVWEAKSLVTLTPGPASSVNQVDALRLGQQRYVEKAANDSFTALAALKANMPQGEIREKVQVEPRGGDQLALTARASTGQGALSLANASGLTLAATIVSGEALEPAAGDRLGAVVVGPSPEAVRTSPTDTEILVAGLLGGAAVLLLAGVLTLVRRSNAPR